MSVENKNFRPVCNLSFLSKIIEIKSIKILNLALTMRMRECHFWIFLLEERNHSLLHLFTENHHSLVLEVFSLVFLLQILKLVQ